MSFAVLTPEEAASHIKHDMTVGFSGFTPAGSPKAVSKAVAAFAKAEHEAGRPFKIGVITGASTSDNLDGELARADAVKFRTPYQSNGDLRKAINAGRAEFFDMHLSVLAQQLRAGFLGKVDVAVIEAADITDDGEIILTSGVGVSPTVARLADKIIIELNANHPKTLRGLHDIYEPLDPPYRQPIPLTSPSDRIGSPVLKIDPKKVVGIVHTNAPDGVKGFDEVNELTAKVGENVSLFLAAEIKAGRIPKEFLPIQSGVGNIANAVMFALGKNKDIPAFQMYTEVIQDAVIELIDQGRITFASGCSLTVSDSVLKRMYGEFDKYRKHLVLRPQEISNNPEIVRRLGLITMNTPIEADIFGNINSTHVLGSSIMNGIGGSGDFTRNGFLSIFACPSIAKDGKISTIVPAVSHQDHSEHSVSCIITENGIADLRGLSPKQRAESIIANCAHPDYRDQLRGYLALSGKAHTPSTFAKSFRMHEQLQKTGSMQGVSWE
jgi:succinate CoA transferase